jgi:hypothetical protein
MASTLAGTNTNDRIVTKGHGTSALGPSDTSDSGSDVIGGPGLIEGDGIGLDRGTNADVDAGVARTAGADIGDADLDSDTDSVGTGEHAAAGRESRTPLDADRLPDRIERLIPEDEPGPDEDERSTRFGLPRGAADNSSR